MEQSFNQTCTLFWTSERVVTNSDSVYDFPPTNFPTPRIKIYAWTEPQTNVTFNFGRWNPGRDVEVELVIGFDYNRSSANKTTFTVNGGSAIDTTAKHGRIWNMSYSAVAGRWISFVGPTVSLNYGQRNFAPTGSSDAKTTSASIAATAPATVEEWLALHPEWVTP